MLTSIYRPADGWSLPPVMHQHLSGPHFRRLVFVAFTNICISWRRLTWDPVAVGDTFTIGTMASGHQGPHLRQRLTIASSRAVASSAITSRPVGLSSASSSCAWLRWVVAVAALLACSGVMRAMAQPNPFPSLAVSAEGCGREVGSGCVLAVGLCASRPEAVGPSKSVGETKGAAAIASTWHAGSSLDWIRCMLLSNS